MAPILSYLPLQNTSLINRPWRRTIDLNLVMASSSPHDVVNNSQSAEAQPVDVPGTNIATSAAPEAETALSTTTDSTAIKTKETEISQSDDQERNNIEGGGSTISDKQSAPFEETTQHNTTATSEAINSNIEVQDGEVLEAGSVKSAGFEGSLGSDTETSKADGSAGNGKDTVPKYSVKKLAGFKPVSVTKSFLAKAGTATLPIKTAGDKGEPCLCCIGKG
jgi:hypothetical protein